MASLYIAILTPLCTHADEKDLTWHLSSEWSEPHYSQYTATNITQQWRYEQKHATLIISKTKCPTCSQVSQALVDDYDQQENTKAILVRIKGTPGMLRLHESPKGVNLRTYVVIANEYQYEFQLGINKHAKDKISIRLEADLLNLIDNIPIKQ
jgi:hypothetical protein